ncbi:MAG: hypothetical protein ABII72_02095 [Parcubacteria group bacterium]
MSETASKVEVEVSMRSIDVKSIENELTAHSIDPNTLASEIEQLDMDSKVELIKYWAKVLEVDMYPEYDFIMLDTIKEIMEADARVEENRKRKQDLFLFYDSEAPNRYTDIALLDSSTRYTRNPLQKRKSTGDFFDTETETHSKIYDSKNLYERLENNINNKRNASRMTHLLFEYNKSSDRAGKDYDVGRNIFEHLINNYPEVLLPYLDDYNEQMENYANRAVNPDYLFKRMLWVAKSRAKREMEGKIYDDLSEGERARIDRWRKRDKRILEIIYEPYYVRDEHKRGELLRERERIREKINETFLGSGIEKGFKKTVEKVISEMKTDLSKKQQDEFGNYIKSSKDF